jgi:hypothetical protein
MIIDSVHSFKSPLKTNQSLSCPETRLFSSMNGSIVTDWNYDIVNDTELRKPPVDVYLKTDVRFNNGTLLYHDDSSAKDVLRDLQLQGSDYPPVFTFLIEYIQIDLEIPSFNRLNITWPTYNISQSLLFAPLIYLIVDEDSLQDYEAKIFWRFELRTEIPVDFQICAQLDIQINVGVAARGVLQKIPEDDSPTAIEYVATFAAVMVATILPVAFGSLWLKRKNMANKTR